MDFLTRTIAFKSFDDVDITAYVAEPVLEGKQPTIILVHEAWGLNQQIKHVADQYAQQGFVTIAPHLFSREKDLTEQAIEKAMMRIWQIPPEKRNDPTAIRSMMESLPPKDHRVVNYFFTGREEAEKVMIKDLLFCLSYAKSLDNTDTDRLGVTGFCLGGGLTYQLATEYPFNAVVPFYGANPKPLDAVAKINGPIFAVYAGEDQRITSGVPALVESIIRYKKTFQMKIYQGTQHAFFNETRPSYNKAAAQDAWIMTLAFFHKNLKAKQ
ncbi:MAG: dienelactone hydrolase family protein [Candidatus Bathyarchaeota archaeon]|nr:dienelactone hydrolase family protein [Candidatus Bathyarchaeota archaeon]